MGRCEGRTAVVRGLHGSRTERTRARKAPLADSKVGHSKQKFNGLGVLRTDIKNRAESPTR